jgi:hypothetical protein
MYGIRLINIGLVLTLCTLLSGPPAWAQSVRAYFDRDTIYPGDTATLTIETDDQQQSANVEPDLAPLAQDFEVLGTSSGSQIQIINGQRSATTQWRIELAPKSEGTLQVPALQVGSAHTAPLQLKVTPMPPELARQQADHIFIQSEAEAAEKTYVQAQIGYTVRLLYDLPLLDGELSDPQPADAVVERLGEDRNYTTTINGRRYGVLERHYAIFPEKSGELTLPAVRFNGRIASATGAQNGGNLRSQSPFSSGIDDIFRRMMNDSMFSPAFGSMLDGGQRISVAGQPLTLTVQPRAAGYTGKDWLPSEELTLRETWSPEPPQWRVGEPVTRTISIDAKGLAASHLPEPGMAEPANASIYPDQPVSENRTAGGWVYGHREQRMTIVPTAAGTLTLPEVNLNWWDTKAGQQRVATLPAREVRVAAGSGSSRNVPPASVTHQPAAEAASAGQPGQTTREPLAAAVDNNGGLLASLPGGRWPWTVAGLLLLLWLGPLLVWRRHSRRLNRPAQPAAAAITTKPALARQALRQACLANDPQAAAAALLRWAAALWPPSPPPNLGVLAARLQTQQAQLVKRLDQTLYADQAGSWQGAPLWQELQAGLREQSSARQSSGRQLPPLYPQHV